MSLHVLGKLFLAVFAVLYFSSESFAEINLVPPGKRVLLMSSQRRSEFKLDAPELPQLQEEEARKICASAGKTFVRSTPAELSPEELLKIYESKTYPASIASTVSGGVVFEDGAFKLYKFLDETPTPLSQKIEIGSWISTGFFGLGGGMITLVSLISGADAQALIIMGSISAGCTVASAATAAGARIYRKCGSRPKAEGENFQNFVDVENPAEIKQEEVFALPALASEIWCD